MCRDGSGRDVRWTEHAWRLTTERIAAIRPALVRVNLFREWFNPQVMGSQSRVGPYDWHDWRMQAFYKVVRWYQERKTPVMSGLWHSNFDGKDDPGFYTSKGEDSFQSLQVDLLEHLLKVERLTNIRWYTPTNEPKGMGISFEQWSTMIRNTHEGLSEAGLPADLLIGPNSWEDWTAQSANTIAIACAATTTTITSTTGRANLPMAPWRPYSGQARSTPSTEKTLTSRSQCS